MAIVAARTTLLNSGFDCSSHSLCQSLSKAQFFCGFEGRSGADSKQYGTNFQRASLIFGKRRSWEWKAINMEDIGELGSYSDHEITEIDGLIATIIQREDVEANLMQSYDNISIEEWSRILSTVGRKNCELALKAFTFFKQAKCIFTNSEVEEHKSLSSRILKVYGTMLIILVRHGRMEEAEYILSEVQQLGIGPDLSILNTLLTGYSRKGLPERVLDCMLEMQRTGFQPDSTSYEQVFLKLVAAYLNLEHPQVKRALDVIDHMHFNNLRVSHQTYFELLKACWHMSEIEDADKCFRSMTTAGYSGDAKMYFKMMHMHAEKGDYKRAEELFQMSRQAGVHSNSILYETLLLAYCKGGCLNQAFSVFREAKQISRPSLLTYNILLETCTQFGLYSEAISLYNDLCACGLKPNAVTYTSAITALVTSKRYDKAEELYRRMLKSKILPNSRTFTSMIHTYAVRGWTRLGHEVCIAMRNAECVMTPSTYNVMLDMYVRGRWYTEAAQVLKEIESKGYEIGCTEYGILITALGETSTEIVPIAKAVECSEWEMMKVVNQLLLSTLHYSEENNNSSSSMNSSSDLPINILKFLTRLAERGSVEENLGFYNAVMDAMWRKGLKKRAKMMMLEARKLLIWYRRPKYAKMKLMLDVRGLSLGGAQVAVADWLSSAVQMPGIRNNFKMLLITGHSNSSTNSSSSSSSSAVRKAVAATLAELGSPFIETPEGSGKLLASVYEVLNWQSMYGLASALMLLDYEQHEF